MPYEIKKSKKLCPISKPWALVKKDGGKLVACHQTQDLAAKQVQAIYSNSSVDARVASLMAFSQARAMGSETNAGGGATTGAADCSRDENGKFGAGNKCAAGVGQSDDIRPVTHSMPKSKYDDPRNKTSWISPSGDFYPVDRAKNIGMKRGSNTHEDWAFAHGVGGGESQLFGNGWQRVSHSGKTLFIQSYWHQPTRKQLSAVIDHAVATGSFDEVVSDMGWQKGKKTVWSKNERAFCPAGEQGGVDNSCSAYQGTHKPPSDLSGSPAHDLTRILRDDVYSKDADRLYGHNARYASLLAFAQSRDCGQDADGKFSKGNTCASGVAVDVAKGAAKGSILGAAAGFAKTVTPHGAASHAAAGAVIGALKGLRDNQLRPTRVAQRIKNLGMTESSVGNMVVKLGGSAKSVAMLGSTGKNSLTIKVKDGDGNVTHTLDVTRRQVVIYPHGKNKEMSDKQVEVIKKLAVDNFPKQTTVKIRTDSASYLRRLAKNGFTVAAGNAGEFLATVLVAAHAPYTGEAILSAADFAFNTTFTDSLAKKGSGSAKRR